MTETSSLTVRIKNPTKHDLNNLAKMTDRSMSYHTEKALGEYVHREKERIESLAREIHKGIVSLDAGKGIKMTGKLFEDIKQRGRNRLAKLNQ